MYELIQAGENTFYMDCPSKVGFYRTGENTVVLIDSGSDEGAARKVRQILERENWTAEKILVTHSHADHIGGNAFLQKRTGCRIYAKGMERAVCLDPLFEPVSLYGGMPPKSARGKFFMAQPSVTEELTSECLPEGMKVIDLPGHCYEMCGFETPDGAVFLADALSSKETLDKYGIVVIFDVGTYLDTLEKIKTLDGKIFIPSHVTAAEDMKDLAQYNIDATMKIAESILSVCAEPMIPDAVTAKLAEMCGITLDMNQYLLVGSTVRSYISWLQEKNELEGIFENGMLYWRRA